LAVFFTSSVGPLPSAFAQSLLGLPAPGVMVTTSIAFEPLQLKGIMINAKNPFRFDFLVDKGQSGLTGQALNDEVMRLTKYFLTCLTVPEGDLWVNLSPYEKNRIEPENFGITQMGKDLLEQDYWLKQITASLTYPESELGRHFWKKIYEKAFAAYGTTDIPVNTFNKVWIVPKSADVYVQGSGAFIAKSELDVLLEEDYQALEKNRSQPGDMHHNPDVKATQGNHLHALASQVVRELILPELRKEVNEGKNFAVVRQVFKAMILATWYKRHLKDSLLGRMYVGRNEVRGIDIADKNMKEKIFQQYLKAYKKRVYDYIKEDYDPLIQETVPRKYVSGGFDFTQNRQYSEMAPRSQVELGKDLAMATIDLSPISQKISKIARYLIIGGFVMAVAGGTASSAYAQEIMKVTVKPGDTLGQILVDNGWRRPFGEKEGAIKKVGEIVKPTPKNVRYIYPGDELLVKKGPHFKKANKIITPAAIPATSLETPAPASTVNPQPASLEADVQPIVEKTEIQGLEVRPSPFITETHGLPINIEEMLGRSLKVTKSEIDAKTAMSDAHQKVVDAADKQTLRLNIGGGIESNTTLFSVLVGLEYRTPQLTHPTKVYDNRQTPIAKAMDEAAGKIREQGNVFELIKAVKDYEAAANHKARLESIGETELSVQIAEAKEEERRQLSLITSHLNMSLEELPADSNIIISDAKIELGQIENSLQAQGVKGLPQAAAAGSAFHSAVNGVRGNLEVDQRSTLKKMLPSDWVWDFNPTKGSLGHKFFGWMIGWGIPEWKGWPSFDAKKQVGALMEAAANWQDARLSFFRQLKQVLLDLRKDQIALHTATGAWDNRDKNASPEIQAELSASVDDLEKKVMEEELAAVELGMNASLVENAWKNTEEDLIKEDKELVQGEFHQGIVSLQAQAQDWQAKLEAGHKDKKNVPVVLETVQSINTIMNSPLDDKDIEGLPDIDATGGVRVDGMKITTGTPNAVISKTTGPSSNSPDAETFIGGQINAGDIQRLAIQKGGSKKAKDLERQMNFAQEEFAKSQHSKDEGSKEFRQAMYGYITASTAQEIVEAGQGFNFTLMLAHLRAASPNSYTVISPESIDPVHLLVNEINKHRKHSAEEEASLTSAKALVKEFEMQAENDMYQAMADPSKGLHWQAWDKFFKGETPLIRMKDSQGVDCDEFSGILSALRMKLQSEGAGAPPPPDTEPLDIRIYKLHLETAKKLRSNGPAFTYWSAPFLVEVGTSGGTIPYLGVRSGISYIPLHAQFEPDVQIVQMQEDIDQKEAKWRREQITVQAGYMASESVKKILAGQPEERPFIFDVPQEKWQSIANAVGRGQPISRALARAMKQGKDPRTIALSFYASGGKVQGQPGLAVQTLGNISIALTDWVHRASKEELDVWLNDLKKKAELERMMAVRQVMEELKQANYAQEFFNKMNVNFKSKLAYLQAANKEKDLFGSDELAEFSKISDHYQNLYTSALRQLMDSSGKLNDDLLSAGLINKDQQLDGQLAALGIQGSPLKMASLPTVEISGQERAARALMHHFVPSFNKETLKLVYNALEGLSNDQLNDFSAQMMNQFPGSNTLDRRDYLIRNLEKARLIQKNQNKAMITKMGNNPGGVDMDSRLLDLKEHHDDINGPIFDEKALGTTPIDGVMPKIRRLVPVTPGMLRVFLGETPEAVFINT